MYTERSINICVKEDVYRFFGVYTAARIRIVKAVILGFKLLKTLYDIVVGVLNYLKRRMNVSIFKCILAVHILYGRVLSELCISRFPRSFPPRQYSFLFTIVRRDSRAAVIM